MHFVGIATGPHSTNDNVIQIEYVKKLLKPGEAPSIKVTETDGSLNNDVIKSLAKMGISKSKLKVAHDPRSTHQKIESMLSYATTPDQN